MGLGVGGLSTLGLFLCPGVQQSDSTGWGDSSAASFILTKVTNPIKYVNCALSHSPAFITAFGTSPTARGDLCINNGAV